MSEPGLDPLARRERKRGLDALWLFTFVAAFLAVAAPWYVRSLEIDLVPPAATLFVAAAAYFAVAKVTDRLRRGGAVAAVTAASQLVGVGVLAVVWHLAGGVHYPLFVLVFALPVAGAGVLLPRWQVWTSAVAAVAAVAAVTWIESPDLRWYALRAGLPVETLVGLLPEAPSRAGDAFPDVRLPPAFLFAALAACAVLLPALAVLTRALASARSQSARSDDAAELLGAAFRASPASLALVDTASLRVVAASAGFLARLLLDEQDLREKDLFELVAFADRGAVAGLLAADGGEVPAAVYRVGPETRTARLRLDLIDSNGGRYAWLCLEDQD